MNVILKHLNNVEQNESVSIGEAEVARMGRGCNRIHVLNQSSAVFIIYLPY